MYEIGPPNKKIKMDLSKMCLDPDVTDRNNTRHDSGSGASKEPCVDVVLDIEEENGVADNQPYTGSQDLFDKSSEVEETSDNLVDTTQSGMEKKGEEAVRRSGEGEESSGETEMNVGEPFTWRGVPLGDLDRVGTTLPPQYPPAQHSRHHTVCITLPIYSGLPEPFPRWWKDVWDQRHVKMPWSAHSSNLAPIVVDGEQILENRWKLIKTSLRSNMTSVAHITQAIFNYNTRYSQSRDWTFQSLEAAVEEYTQEENRTFFQKTLPGMVDLCLSGPDELTCPLPLLTAGQSASVTLSQRQIAVLLANAFFCTFPRRNSQGRNSEYSEYPSINMNRLLSANSRRPEAQQGKIKCILSYFSQVVESMPQGVVTFTRQSIPWRNFPKWENSAKTLTRLHITAEGTIEGEGAGMLQADFANKFVGGGVLGEGLVQEEIRFTICPELIVARLFTEVLRDNEVLIVHGPQQFTKYKGYGDSFVFNGIAKDDTDKDISLRRHTTLVAMDAIKFHNPQLQFRSNNMEREMNKAFSAFTNNECSKLCAVATGNWGCGAFGGDPRLKFLLQMIAAAEVGRDVCYFTFGNKTLVKECYGIYKTIQEQTVTVGNLYRILKKYNPEQDLFQYLYNQILSDLDKEDVYCAETESESSSHPSSPHQSRQESPPSSPEQTTLEPHPSSPEQPRQEQSPSSPKQPKQGLPSSSPEQPRQEQSPSVSDQILRIYGQPSLEERSAASSEGEDRKKRGSGVGADSSGTDVTFGVLEQHSNDNLEESAACEDRNKVELCRDNTKGECTSSPIKERGKNYTSLEREQNQPKITSFFTKK